MTIYMPDHRIERRYVAVERIEDGDDDNGTSVRIYSAHGIELVRSWSLPEPRVPDVLPVGEITLMRCPPGRLDDYIMVGFRPAEDVPLELLLPPSLCPNQAVMTALIQRVDALQIDPLREFARRALLHPDAIRHFWSCPASRSDHHAFPGGSAMHTLEVVEAVATTRALPTLERELGIVYGLLHDYGKIWCLVDALRDPTERRNHEAIGRAKLLHNVQKLRAEDRMLGAIMDELLGGPRAPRETNYPLAIRNLVQNFDQLSCERTRMLFPELRAVYEWH